MVNIAVIPARGGSKRIPRKNLASLGGKALISWTVEAAMASSVIDEVFISSDDPEILATAERLGAKNFGLRIANCDDFAPSSAVTIDTINQYEKTKGLREVNLVFQLLPTCPFRSSAHIDDFYRESQAKPENSTVLSVVRPMGFNANWDLVRDDEKGFRPASPAAWGRGRSQETEPRFFLSGAIWVAKPEVLREQGSFHGISARYQEVPWLAGFDIDDKEELNLASSMMEGVARPL